MVWLGRTEPRSGAHAAVTSLGKTIPQFSAPDAGCGTTPAMTFLVIRSAWTALPALIRRHSTPSGRGVPKMSERRVPTDAGQVVPPLAVGGLAAALQIYELARFLGDRVEVPGVAVETFVDPLNRSEQRTSYARRTNCRFDHERWEPAPIALESTVQSVLAGPGRTAQASLFVDGAVLIERWACTACQTTFNDLRFYGGPFAGIACPRCGGLSSPVGASARDELDKSLITDSPDVGELSLASLGLRDGDLFGVRHSKGRSEYLCVARSGVVSVFDGEDRGHDEAGILAIIGCGNVGSQVAAHAARMRGIRRLILVDPDRFEAGNLVSQAIGPADIGRAKARLLAERILALNPSCETLAFVERIERLPVGYFRDAILLGCVDSRAARQAINRVAWRVGRAWIDAGIDPGSGCVRVVAYRCEEGRPCLECAWDESDYETLEQEHPCREITEPTGAGAAARGESR
ncbi:MAG: hypothetical protein D6815_11080 [Candidatus Dadabacteria bacterium]|nr:MAG: hypothetical protein D6815_11080 [Candidatus Dadabacteria bacterium]